MSTPEPTDALVPQPVAGPPAPVEPAESAESAEPAVVRRRSRAPWIVGGVVFGLLFVGSAVAAALLFFAPQPTAGPEDAVLAYDQAYADADCDLYFSATTVGYREALAPTCGDFEAEAREFAAHFSDYGVVVQSTEVAGGTATVVTTETWLLDGQESSAEYTYTLVHDGGSWRIDALD